MGDEAGYGAGQEQQGDQGSEVNPLWADFMNDLPQEFHEKALPYLQKWDADVNQRFQKVHSTYEPYKDIINSGATPEVLAMGLNILNNLETNPEYVYNSIGEAYKDVIGKAKQAVEQGQGETPPSQEDDPYNAKFAEQERQIGILAKHLYEKEQTAMSQAAEQALDAEYKAAQNKFKDRGPFDEEFVNAKLVADSSLTVEQAAEAFYQWQDKVLGRSTPPPFIMGSGGGMPGNKVNVRDLKDSEINDSVVGLLKSMNQQKRQ